MKIIWNRKKIYPVNLKEVRKREQKEQRTDRTNRKTHCKMVDFNPTIITLNYIYMQFDYIKCKCSKYSQLKGRVYQIG